MYKYLKPNLISYKKPINNGKITSLGLQWTKNDLQNLHADPHQSKPAQNQHLNQVMFQVRRKITTQEQLALMRSVGLQAWNKTKKLLSKEVKRHPIKSELIDSWKVAVDSFNIYKKDLDVYQKQASQSKLSMVINLVRISSFVPQTYSEKLAPNESKEAMIFFLGPLRQKYTQQYFKVIGFVSMQFNYISKMLLQLISDAEQSLLSNYFKMIRHLSLRLSCF